MLIFIDENLDIILGFLHHLRIDIDGMHIFWLISE